MNSSPRDWGAPTRTRLRLSATDSSECVSMGYVLFACAVRLWIAGAAIVAGNAAADEHPGTDATRKRILVSDGKVEAIDIWGDFYDGYQHSSFITRPRFSLVWENRSANIKSVTVDSVRKKVYWLDSRGSRSTGSLRRANFDGTHLETLLRDLDQPRGLQVDASAAKLYWADMGNASGTDNGVRRCNLDGTERDTVLTGFGDPSDVCLDAARGQLYIADSYKIVTCALDGSAERLFYQCPFDKGPAGHLVLTPDNDRLCWIVANQAFPASVYSIGLDSKRMRREFSSPYSSQFYGADFDPASNKIYWVDKSYGNLRRANLDGSESELLIDGLHSPEDVVIEPASRTLFFTDNGALPSGDRRLYRVPVPTPLRPVKLPAPPLISELPLRSTAGDQITVRGKQLAHTTAVAFIDEATAAHVPAKFDVSSDTALAVTVPRLSPQCESAVIVVTTTGGVTVTIPRDATLVRGSHVFDRYHRPYRPIYVVLGEPAEKKHGCLLELENGIAAVEPLGTVVLGGRGGATVFLMNGSGMTLNGSERNVVYYEPFAHIEHMQLLSAGVRFVRVPAIRPSFVSSLLAIQRGAH